MNKYQKALESLHRTAKFLLGSQVNKEKQILQELVDKEIPMKPATVMLFGEEAHTCPADRCGVGLNPDESIWHKSSYCGNCGQKIDWSEDE